MGKSLFIFFTEQIVGEKSDDEDDKKFLSYNYDIEEKLGQEEIYINTNDLLVFYNSKDYLKKKNYKELVKEVFEKIEKYIPKDKYEKIYIFFHGSEIEGKTTEFAYQEDKSQELTKELTKEVEVFYFQHTDDDDINYLLINYIDAFYDSNIEGINLNDKIKKYIEKVK